MTISLPQQSTMASLPFAERLWGRSFSQKVDTVSIEEYHIPGLVLMENAGLALVELVRTYMGLHGGPLLILAGPGNNGGDALVAAWHLWDQGYQPAVFFYCPQGRSVSASCAQQLKRLADSRIPVTPYVPGTLSSLHWQRPVIIDGLLGIGFRGTLAKDDPYAIALHEAAQIEGRHVIAVDLPSGCDADYWLQRPPPLTADVTLTFGGPKPIHRLSPGRSYCGEIVVADIGFDPSAVLTAAKVDLPAYHLVDVPPLLAEDPWDRLGRDASKFDRGHVLIIGGSEGKCGAPLMAALAALRAGCGWATVAIPRAFLRAGVTLPLEVTYEDLFDKDGRVDATALASFCSQRKVRAILVGPGMVESPLDPSVLQALRRLNHDQGIFTVIDAGALHGLGDRLLHQPFVAARTVATPHPGEWRRMVSPDRDIIDENGDISACLQDIGGWGVTLLYKSATPLVLDPAVDRRNQIAAINTGGMELAKAGSGDVLAGIIAAHGALGLDARFAAVRSYAWLARIGAQLTADRNKHSLLPTDLIEGLTLKR